MYRVCAFLIVLFISTGLSGQETGAQSVFDDYLNPYPSSSFISIPGLSFSSSAGFSYSSYGSYGSQGFGYYMGHFRYRIGAGWSLNWDVGVRSAMSGVGAGQSPDLFIPNLNLTYRSGKRFMISFQYRQYQYPFGAPYLYR